MGEILDEALAKYGRMTENEMADFKAAMLPFFAPLGIGEHDVSVEDYLGREHWTVAMLFPANGVSEATMEERIVPYFESIGGEEEDQCLTMSDERSGYFEWVVTLPSCPKEVRAAMEEDYAATEAERSEANDTEDEGVADLLEGIKNGKLKSKVEDGYFVMQGEPYDDIEAGEKTVEFRDLTEYNLKRTIGIKSVRLQRGYGHPGQPPKKMRWTVTDVQLANDYGEECNPFDVPEGFEPNMIAVHLGERIG